MDDGLNLRILSGRVLTVDSVDSFDSGSGYQTTVDMEKFKAEGQNGALHLNMSAGQGVWAQ